MAKDQDFGTRLAHAGRDPSKHFGAVNPPVYRASTFIKPTLDEWEKAARPNAPGYAYGLYGTPTSEAFEDAMASLYGCDGAVTMCSGLAVITIALATLTSKGDHVLAPDSTYMPTRRFCSSVLARFGVETSYYDPLIGAGIAELMRPNTKLVLTESPGSLTFEVQDVPAIVAAAHAGRAKVLLDNSWATALNNDPFRMGVDVVVEAITSYVGGHADVLMGVVLARGALGAKLRGAAKTWGQCCSADDQALALRGLRTLELRMRRSEATGLALAGWLKTRPEVARVLHPALPDHPGHDLWKRDFRGASGVFAIVLHPVSHAALAAFLDGLKLFGIGYSWGGYESVVMPADPTKIRTVTRWTEPGQVIRISAGLESPEDLIADLDAGLARMRAA
jgi:cystathionine beta-lyase